MTALKALCGTLWIKYTSAHTRIHARSLSLTHARDTKLRVRDEVEEKGCAHNQAASVSLDPFCGRYVIVPLPITNLFIQMRIVLF